MREVDLEKMCKSSLSPLLFAGAVATAAGASVGVVIVSVLIGGVAISYGLEWLDSEFGITQGVKDMVNKVEKDIEKNYKAPQEYRSGVPSWLLR